METRVEVPIIKLNDEQRLFGGWAYVRSVAGEVVVDHSGDTIDTEEAWSMMKDAFTRYALEIRKGDNQHEVFEVSDLVEMMIFDKERAEMLGLPPGFNEGVFVSFRAADTPEGDELWEAIKSGERRAMSIVGSGFREAIE